MESLYERLLQYSKEDLVPMHMPGHKRNIEMSMDNPYQIDVTEVPGTDDLHHPEEVLKDEMERAARMFHSEHTFFLVGGSTSGILTAISACCQRDGHILIARNCHKSVYHSAFLWNLQVNYLLPQMDSDTGIFAGVTLAEVEEALAKDSQVQCVVITSPTYEGVVSQIHEIAEYLHERQIPLIVDEAHGAHFPFQEKTPASAVSEGADLVIQSLHKTLPALTQTGLLHVNGDLVDLSEVRMYEQIYQTSSPSYVLMASISKCLDYLAYSYQDFARYNVRLREFYDKMKKLKHLSVLPPEGRDMDKIVIVTAYASIDGSSLERVLREVYHIQLEMSQQRYAIAMTSVMDTRENFERLAKALLEVDAGLSVSPERAKIQLRIPECRKSAYNAHIGKSKSIPLEESAGSISGEYVYLYPPGIPYLVPGECIEKELLDLLLEYKRQEFALRGMADADGSQILVFQ